MTGTAVLGASGFLGAHVVAVAHGLAREAATFADPQGPPVFAQGRNVDAAPRFSQPRDGARWIARDLGPPGAAAGLLDELRPVIVIQCAALSRAADCELDPEGAQRLNLELAEEVARWCATQRARLVHVSTDLVFGSNPPPRPTGFREEDPAGAVSVYGATKLAGEAAVLGACPDALVVRLPLLYGNSGGRGLGASDALLEAVERDSRPRLFVDEWRTPLEVGDAGRALVELAHGESKGLLHVAGPDRVSRHELGLAVLEAMGLERKVAEGLIQPAHQAEVETGAPRPSDVALDAARARRLLTSPLHGVAEGTQRATS